VCSARATHHLAKGRSGEAPAVTSVIESIVVASRRAAGQ
jgi:hypothetical protein